MKSVGVSCTQIAGKTQTKKLGIMLLFVKNF